MRVAGNKRQGTHRREARIAIEEAQHKHSFCLMGGVVRANMRKLRRVVVNLLPAGTRAVYKPVHRVGVGSSMSKDTWMPLPVEGYLGGGEPEKEKGGEDGDWRPPRMDPKLQSLLRHCALELWVPLLEAEVPKAVANFDMWLKLGEECTRDLFQEILESLYEENEYEEKLPKAKLEKFIGELYPKKQKKGAKAAPPKAALGTTTTATSAAMARAADKAVTPDVTDAPAASAPPAPPPAVAEPPAEAPVTDIPACERWTWDQDVEEVRITLRGLPLGTKPKDVKYKALARFITLSVNGEVVLDKEELAQLIVSEDVDFEIKDAPGRASRVLIFMMPKVNNHPAHALWEHLLKRDAPPTKEQPLVEKYGPVDPAKVGLPSILPPELGKKKEKQNA